VSPLSDVGISAAAGIPPDALRHAAWSWPNTLMLLLVYIGAFVVAVWFVAWLDVKLSARQLLRDIHRELGIGKRR